MYKRQTRQFPVEAGVFHETLKESSVQECPKAAKVLVLREEDWRVPIRLCLEGKTFANDRSSEQRVRLRARDYSLVEGVLYKRGVCEPALRCLARSEGKDLLKEIHSGLCSSQIAPRALVAKAFRQCFYWPTTAQDAEELVRACSGCQWMGWQSHVPATSL